MNNRPLDLSWVSRILGVPTDEQKVSLRKRFKRYPHHLTDRELLLAWDIYCEDKMDSLIQKLDKALEGQ